MSKPQEDYVGRIGNDMYYPKPTAPQTPPIRSNQNPPEGELAKTIQAFDAVDCRKLNDVQLQAYMDVAYESYVYAETIIDTRRKRGKAK